MKRGDGAAVVGVGVGVAACAVCCAGPILGFLAAIGLGTVLGVAVFGITGVLIALLAVPVLIRYRRRRRCASPRRVPVPPPTARTPT
jgi:hypothetical protein